MVSTFGKLTIEDSQGGGQITGGANIYHGAGVYVEGGDRGGTFIMNGGTITNNTAIENGGGVFVHTHAKFTMNGGSISNNTINGYANGGGVYDYGFLDHGRIRRCHYIR